MDDVDMVKMGDESMSEGDRDIPEIPDLDAIVDAVAESSKRPFLDDLEVDDSDRKRVKTELSKSPDPDDIEKLLAEVDFDALVDQTLEERAAQEVAAAAEGRQLYVYRDRFPDATRCAPFLPDAQKSIRIMNYPVLASLALQILLALSQEPFDDTFRAIRDVDSEAGKAYITLKSLFFQVAQLYAPNSNGAPFLSIDLLEPASPTDRTTIHTANLAWFSIMLFEGIENISPEDMQILVQNSVQVLFGGRDEATPRVEALLLEIRIQGLIAALPTMEELQDKPREDQLQELFWNNLENQLLERCIDWELTARNTDFLASAQTRLEAFTAELRGIEGNGAEISNILRQRYPFQELLRKLGGAIYARLGGLQAFSSNFTYQLKLNWIEEADGNVIDVSFLDDLVENAVAGFQADVAQVDEITQATAAALGDSSAMDLNEDEQDELAALVNEKTYDYVKNTLDPMTPTAYQPAPVPTPTGGETGGSNTPVPQFGQLPAQPPSIYQQGLADAPPATMVNGEVPELPPNQSHPSAVLYDKARQAALSKTTAHTRREGAGSSRRPWTQEEERALMAGLDMVKGAHWSQILTLFGPNGTVSDILRDRTQVQLKDKARNLKLFFLKTNAEMPYYLTGVTGELKTRAPQQAARKEAEEAARRNSEEQQAHVQGIMTLAGGLQNPSQNRSYTSTPTQGHSNIPSQPHNAAPGYQASPTGPPAGYRPPPPVSLATYPPGLAPALAVAKPSPQTPSAPQTPVGGGSVITGSFAPSTSGTPSVALPPQQPHQQRPHQQPPSSAPLHNGTHHGMNGKLPTPQPATSLPTNGQSNNIEPAAAEQAT